MTSPLLIRSFKATAVAIGDFLIAKASAGANTVEIATANTELLLGSVGNLGVEAGGLADITMVGWSEVRLGGTVAFNDPLTADAAGKAIKALPANSTQVRIIGYAMLAGVADDVIPYHVALGHLSKASA